MSVSKQEQAKDDLEGPNESSSVQVLIEPATPRKDEESSDDENSELNTDEDSVNKAEDMNLKSDGRTELEVKDVKEMIADADPQPQVVTENENNNEDSKGNENDASQQTSTAESDPGENTKNEDPEEISGDDKTNVISEQSVDSSNVSEKEKTTLPTENDVPHAAMEQTIGEQLEGNDDRSEHSGDGTEGQDAKQIVEHTRTPANIESTSDKKQEEPSLASEMQPNRDTVAQEDMETVPETDNMSSELARDKCIDENSRREECGEIDQGSKNEAEKESEDSKNEEKADGEATERVTTDITTQDMTRERKDHEVDGGSVEERERTPKTPESIAASVDLPAHMAVPSPTKGRPVTAESNYVYNEQDFLTPDYDMYGPTPTDADGEASRSQLSPSKKDRQIASRGESTKSVTFADDVGRVSEKGDDAGDVSGNQNLESSPHAELKQDDDEEEDGSDKKDGEKGHPDGTLNKDDYQKEEAEEGLDIFPTAVSDEKLEEAKRKQREKDNFTRKESLAIELFGASKFEPESMEDVITKKAYEHFELGCVLAERGEFWQAVLGFDKALNLLPREVRFYLMRGEAYLQLCDFQSAILNLKKACVLEPTNSDYYSRLAFIYFFQGQSLFDQCLFAEALESFSRAAEMKPDVIAYHTRSIACLAALQRHGECLALVNKRLETERTNPHLFIMRARLHQLFRNSTLCYYDLKDALALCPEQQEARSLMRQLEEKAEESRDHAIRLQLQGKFKDSLNKITVAIEMNPSIPEYHLQRGALQKRLHDYNAAIDDFLLAMDKTEHNERSDVYTDAQRQLLLTYNDFAVECFLGGHYEEAILLLNKALKGEKREKGLYINRGDCFFRLQELHFALADYHQALEIAPADPAIRSRVAAIHAQFGQQDYEELSYQDADARFTIAVQNNPRHGAYYIARCKVRLMVENATGARQDFLMGMHLDPSNTDILTLMPRLYPGKSVADVMRTKQAREAKAAADNAVITASPVRLPGLHSSDEEGGETKGADGAKRVTFDPSMTQGQDTVMPSIKSCMDEMEFNKILNKEKKKISSKVKTMLHDRGTLFVKDRPKLKPQPPSRPYQVRGGHWKNPDPPVQPGWRTFSLGVGLME